MSDEVERHVGRLRDKRGQAYQLTIAIIYRDLVRVTVNLPRSTVGYANLYFESPSELMLSDIQIEPPYRNRGIGSQLIAVIKQLAREKQVQTVTGFITREDSEGTPHLLEWYKRHGFAVQPIDGQNATKAIALLRLTI
jgi:N-acetylglutamate synthase-like GNAT family acetyltransferase